MAKANNIAFENLRADMARKQLSIAEMAGALGITRDTLGYKLSRKRPINLDEAMYSGKQSKSVYTLALLATIVQD